MGRNVDLLGDGSWFVEDSEEPDWGYARNRQALLKSPLSEYSTSVFTAPLKVGGEAFFGLNRDFPWQGWVFGPLEGELYKVLDAVYVSVGRQLDPSGVVVSPHSIKTLYESEDGSSCSLVVTLERPGTCLRVQSSAPCRFVPLLDTRRAEAYSAGPPLLDLSGRKAQISSEGVPFVLGISGFDGFDRLDEWTEWRYKLGDGFRWIDDQGRVLFREEKRWLYLPGVFSSEDGSITFNIDVLKKDIFDGVGFWPRPRAVVVTGQDRLLCALLKLRIDMLGSFGVATDLGWFPEAGCWWFRRPWVRDALEGIRWNLETYRLVSLEGAVSRLVRTLLTHLGRSYALPIIMDDGRSSTSDAPPQLLSVACDICHQTKNPSLPKLVVQVARRLSKRFLEGKDVSSSVLDESLICSHPSSSWVDSVLKSGSGRRPARIPLDWGLMNLEEPNFALCEVNALHIESLSKVLQVCREVGLNAPAEVTHLVEILEGGFERWFDSRGGLPAATVAPGEGMVDERPSSPGVVAASLLGERLWSMGRLRGFWETVRKELLVWRRPVLIPGEAMPFGIMVFGGGAEPYLDDRQYHANTIWPRDTPYLIRLLELIGEDVSGLLLSNLDHQVCEAGFGYCSELFSLPTGRNPAPGRHSDNPVPVKNPAQYWSHWCDPFLRHQTELGVAVQPSP